MANVILDNQALPGIPAAGKTVLFPESGAKRLTYRDDSGRTYTIPGAINNYNTADVVANAADTYVTGSGLVVPTGLLMQVGTSFRWRIYATKTAFGTAAPIWVVRVGTAGTTGDSARLTFTQVALQTAAADAAFIEVDAILRNVGASGILAGGLAMTHVLATTGFSTLGANVQQVTSAAFDTTVANSIIGLSVNPGASGVWTLQVVSAEMRGI
jgi:hypothetical protein